MRALSVKEKNKATILKISEFFNGFVSKKEYYIPALFFSIMAYLYDIVNRTISIDDLARELYYGQGKYKIAGLRWAQYFENRIFSKISILQGQEKFFGIVLFFVGTVIICCIINELIKEQNVWVYSIFSCILLTFPLVNEIFEYNEACIPRGIGLIIVSYCILYQLVNNVNKSDVIYLGTLISIVMSSLESMIPVYVELELIVLYFKKIKDKDVNWIKEGAMSTLPLFVGLVLKFLVGYLLIYLYNLEFKYNGDTQIMWLVNFSSSLKEIVNNGWYYFIRGLSYFPIGEFAIACIIGFILTAIYAKKDYVIYIIYILILISLFSISLIQGDYLKYRTAETIGVFVSFVYAFSYYYLYSKKEKFNVVVIIACMLLIYKQALCLNELLQLNNQRSENELEIVNHLGYDLFSNFDISKTIVFCGEYNISSFIEDQITIKDNSLSGKIENSVRLITGHQEKPVNVEFVSSNVNSNINWSMHAFGGQSMMKNLFSYCGYDIKTIDKFSNNNELLEYNELAKKLEMKQFEIRELENIILVYFGDIQENVKIGENFYD